MRFRLGFLPTLTLIAALFSGSSAHAVSLRLASLAPQDSAWGRLIQELAADVKKETGGQVDFKLFLGDKLGNEGKVVKKLGRGVDGAFFTGQGVGQIYPGFRIQELPFLSETYEEADKVRKALWPLFTAAFEKDTDFVLLGPGETGMVYLLSKNTITGVEDLRKARLWVWEGDEVASQTFQVFGVSPRPLDILTVVQQIKSGGIDAVYNSPAGAVALGWTSDLKHISGVAFAYASGAFVLTKDAWKKIPEAQREKVRSIVQKFGEKIILQTRTDNQAALERLTGTGGGFTKTPIAPAQYAEFKKTGMGAWPKLAEAIKAGHLLGPARQAVSK